MNTFSDIAIPIAWPDQTARGDEKWMSLLKKAGFVKNLNFRVGHAAILLIEHTTGKIIYFDFGRYLVPRGYGRTRSAAFDPRLQIATTATFDEKKNISNLEAILEELFAKEQATHGSGRLLFSICKGVSFEKGCAYARQLVEEGPILYGALAKNNNSCSRFVAQTMVAALPAKDRRIQKLFYPESLKASPTSNVANATPDNTIYCYYQHILTSRKMSRFQSLRFQIGLLKENFTVKGAKKLGCDKKAGFAEIPEKPGRIPNKAQWIGGIGEGAWFDIVPARENLYEISKFNYQGQLEYKVEAYNAENFDIRRPYEFTYHFTFNEYSVLQNDKIYTFVTQSTEEQRKQNKKAI